MTTRYRRIQVTEDPELERALRAAAPHFRPGQPRSQQVRELALAGARVLAGESPGRDEREALLRRLDARFERPERAGIDWELLAGAKHRAWRAE